MVNIFFIIFILSVSVPKLVNQGDLLRKLRDFSEGSTTANQLNSIEPDPSIAQRWSYRQLRHQGRRSDFVRIIEENKMGLVIPASAGC
jgi:hypothetical protein